MTPEEAVAILQNVFSAPVDSLAAPGHSARLVVGAPRSDGKATVALTMFRDGRVRDVKEQELSVLPAVGLEGIDAAGYEMFARGVRLAVSRCDLSAVLPHDLLLTNLLRVPGLRAVEDVAGVILDREARMRAFAALEVDDYGREQGLPMISDASIQERLWVLMSNGEVEEAEAAARSLRDDHRTEATPYLLRFLEDWQQRMWHSGGISWVSDDGRNVDVVLARIVEPLLKEGLSPSQRERLEALEVAGMFDEDHETAAYEWMFRT